MTRGKVVLVPFPFDDFSGTKVRPAVCLTDPIGIHRHVILAFISSRMPADLLETDLILDSVQADFATTGLLEERCQVLTIDNIRGENSIYRLWIPGADGWQSVGG
ncbi:MAG: hypothetical protein KKH04_18375 [Proteobacteria bacterium]|nr:hypothetical protein [Pseudomonadota bacterium]